jgi:hypothetical protein
VNHRHTSKIADELQRLAEEYGGELKPRVVVDAARDPDSPLHDSFEWDDSRASEAWRLHQARMLIRAVVTYETVGSAVVPCRVFVSLTPDRQEDGAGYRLTTTVLSDVDRREQMLRDARAEMQRFRDKYRSLTELAAVFEAIDRVDLLSELTAGTAA